MVVNAVDRNGEPVPDFAGVHYGATEKEWEEAADESRFVELIDGRLILHSPAELGYPRAFGCLHRLIGDYVEESNLG